MAGNGYQTKPPPDSPDGHHISAADHNHLMQWFTHVKLWAEKIENNVFLEIDPPTDPPDTPPEPWEPRP